MLQVPSLPKYSLSKNVLPSSIRACNKKFWVTSFLFMRLRLINQQFIYVGEKKIFFTKRYFGEKKVTQERTSQYKIFLQLLFSFGGCWPHETIKNLFCMLSSEQFSETIPLTEMPSSRNIPPSLRACKVILGNFMSVHEIKKHINHIYIGICELILF